MAYTVAWERNGIYITYLERVTFSEFMGAILNIHADSNYATIRYVIHDMVAATELDFSEVDMTKIVAHELGARYTNTKVRPAVVSTDSTMAEMIKVFCELTNLDVGRFQNVADARNWCNQAVE